MKLINDNGNGFNFTEPTILYCPGGDLIVRFTDDFETEPAGLTRTQLKVALARFEAAADKITKAIASADKEWYAP